MEAKRTQSVYGGVGDRASCSCYEANQCSLVDWKFFSSVRRLVLLEVFFEFGVDCQVHCLKHQCLGL